MNYTYRAMEFNGSSSMRGIKKNYQITVTDQSVLNKQYANFGATIYDTVLRTESRFLRTETLTITRHGTGSIGSM
jgi:hypothetical protein